MENFNLLSTVLINKQGKTRSDDENKIILLALKAALKRELKKNITDKKIVFNWNSLCTEVSEDLHVCKEHVANLRKLLIKEGEICKSEKN